jgi:hypothetical protein
LVRVIVNQAGKCQRMPKKKKGICLKEVRKIFVF